jgi:hypothetical protein
MVKRRRVERDISENEIKATNPTAMGDTEEKRQREEREMINGGMPHSLPFHLQSSTAIDR